MEFYFCYDITLLDIFSDLKWVFDCLILMQIEGFILNCYS